MAGVPPVAFVVDDDISARDSLDSLIRYEGSLPNTFAPFNEFLNSRRIPFPSSLVINNSHARKTP